MSKNTYSHFHKFEAWTPAGTRAVVWVDGKVHVDGPMHLAIHAQLDDLLELKEGAANAAP